MPTAFQNKIDEPQPWAELQDDGAVVYRPTPTGEVEICEEGAFAPVALLNERVWRLGISEAGFRGVALTEAGDIEIVDDHRQRLMVIEAKYVVDPLRMNSEEGRSANLFDRPSVSKQDRLSALIVLKEACKQGWPVEGRILREASSGAVVALGAMRAKIPRGRRFALPKRGGRKQFFEIMKVDARSGRVAVCLWSDKAAAAIETKRSAAARIADAEQTTKAALARSARQADAIADTLSVAGSSAVEAQLQDVWANLVTSAAAERLGRDANAAEFAACREVVERALANFGAREISVIAIEASRAQIGVDQLDRGIAALMIAEAALQMRGEPLHLAVVHLELAKALGVADRLEVAKLYALSAVDVALKSRRASLAKAGLDWLQSMRAAPDRAA